MGLGFVYSYKLNPDPARRALIERVHRRQKWAYLFLYGFSILPGLNFILGIGFFGTTPFRIFGATVTALLVGFILWTNRQLPYDQRNKLIFLSRLFLFPLSFFSIIAAVGYRAIHGVEYIFVYRKLFANSRGEAPNALWLGGLSVLLFVFTSFVALFSMNKADGLGMYFAVGDQLPVWFRLVCAVATTRSYMHFYLDRIMFRMRDQAVSQWIRPLLSA